MRSHCIIQPQVSLAWSEVLTAVLTQRTHEQIPLLVRIENLAENGIDEDLEVRGLLDDFLKTSGKSSVETVSTTIFPERRWVEAQGDRRQFFNRFLRTYPRLKRIDLKNRKGTYFGRLIEPLPNLEEGQLERVIQLYTKKPSGVIRMKLQAAVFRAEMDHERGARQGFPCMQHISFVPQEKKLSMNAFYATQLVVEKAYGNYLGLIQLGRFMASQMGLTFDSLNVFVGVAKLGDIRMLDPKFEALAYAARSLIQEHN